MSSPDVSQLETYPVCGACGRELEGAQQLVPSPQTDAPAPWFGPPCPCGGDEIRFEKREVTNV